MKKIFLILLLAASFISEAQIGSYDQIQARRRFTLRNWYVTDIKNDTIDWSTGIRYLPTAKAVYDFVIGRTPTLVGGSGDGIRNLGLGWGLIRLNDSTYVVDTSLIQSKYQSEKTRDSLVFILNQKADSANVWYRNGNFNINPLLNYIGTNDLKDFVSKTNATERLRIKAAGNVHIRDTVKTSNLASLPSDSADYEIAIFPDIQNMIGFRSFYSRAMFQWLKDSMTARNVKALIQVGDITNLNTAKEWDTLTNQLSLITPTGLPYIMPPGNHDYGNAFNPSTRDSTMYNNYLGVAHFTGKPFYGGHYGVSNENYWIKFNAGDRKYVVVGLEFIPRDVVLNWAGALIDSIYNADPSVEVMLVTHAYISQIGELATDTSVYSGATYGMSADNSGLEIWQKLVKSRPSIKWVFSGHFLVPNIHANRGLTARIVGVNDYGGLVNQIFVNYQDDVDWGDGYFLRLQFKPSKGTVEAKFYNAYTNAYDTREPSYTLEDPGISIRSSIGVKNDATIGRDLRVGGTLKVEQLSPFRIPYISNDHKFRDTDSLMYNSDSAKLVLQNIRAKGKINTDSLEFKYGKMLSRVNGKTRILFGDPITKFYLPETFDTTRADGNISRTAIYAFAAIDSGHKMARGQMIRTYKSYEPVDGFTSSYLGSNIYQPEQSNRFDTRWYLPKGSFTAVGFLDFPNANVYYSLGIGSRIDSTDITFGNSVFGGIMNNAARIDLAPNASQYTNNYGMITNYGSVLKATRKINSSIEWFNHYAVAATGGTDNGQTLKTMVGLYIEPMQTGFTERLWGYLQTASTGTYNAMNKLLVGTDTTIANMGSGNTWLQDGLRLTGLPTGTKVKFLMIDAAGDVYAADTTGLYGGGGGGGSMVYPGAGIAVSDGSGWLTSITDNSSNWNTAFGWGNHAGLYPTNSRFTDSLAAHTTRFNGITGSLALKLNVTDTTGKTWDWSQITGEPTFLTSYTETDPIYSVSSWFSTTNNSSNWNTAFTDRNKWDGGATGLTASTGRTSLGGTTVGQNLFTLTNPSAITFPRFNADNTVTALDATSFRTAIGAGTGSGTLTDVTATNNTGQTWTITGTTVKNLSLALTSSAVGLGSVENTALSTWAGTSNITTLGTVATGTWNATAIATGKGGTPSGGTTGQVLVKNSATNYDYSWTTISASGVTTIGAINGIAKSANGLGISGSNLHGQTVDATYPGLMTPSMLADLTSNSYIKIWKRASFDSTARFIDDSTLGLKAIAVQINGSHLAGILTDSTILYNILSQMSIISDASGFKLSGDLASPGNLMMYGTNGSGVKGWYAQPAGGSLSDGDKGDVTVTSGVWTIDNGVVTLAKMANIATGKVIGRTTAGTGVPEEVTAAIMNLTSPATGDHLEYNSSTGEWENKVLMSLAKTNINGASQDTAVLNDMIPIYDATEAVNKKIKVDDLLHIYNRTFRRTSAYDYFNEFVNTVTTTSPGAEVQATNSGTGAATSTQATDASNRIGLVRTTTGTTATGRSYVNAAGGSVRLGGGTWVYEQYINITTLSTGTERYQALFGFFDTYTAANQVDGAYLLYDEGGASTGSTASANWQLVTTSNSTRTFTTTSTAVGAATWVKLRVEVNAAGNSVSFFINDTNVGTHTTNIPTAAGRECGFGWGMIKSIGTTARTMDTDYLMVVADYTTDK